MSANSSQVLAIIGQGYVGLPLAMAAVDAGWRVIGVDNLEAKVSQINAGSSPVEDISDTQLQIAVASGAYKATTDFSLINQASVVTICVPTPLDDKREPDLALLRSAAKGLAPFLANETLVVSESTSFPGTLRDIIIPIIDSLKPKDTETIYFASAPERVDPGNEKYNHKNTPRLVSGLTPEATKKAAEFYRSFTETVIEVSSPEVAETAKLLENTFRQVNIALVNEVAIISRALGIDVREVIEAANSKPYGFMKFTPSAGVGGHCIPVDPSYLSYVAEQAGVSATFIQRANEVNLEMPRYIAKRVADDNGGSLKGKKVLVVGVAYKPNVADTRETPAEHLIEALNEMGAHVTWSDSVVGSWQGKESAPLTGADVAIVVTKHDEVSEAEIMSAAPYVFDTTGKVKRAVQL